MPDLNEIMLTHLNPGKIEFAIPVDTYTAELYAQRLGITVEQFRYHYEYHCKCRVDRAERWTYDPECFMGKPRHGTQSGAKQSDSLPSQH